MQQELVADWHIFTHKCIQLSRGLVANIPPPPPTSLLILFLTDQRSSFRNETPMYELMVSRLHRVSACVPVVFFLSGPTRPNPTGGGRRKLLGKLGERVLELGCKRTETNRSRVCGCAQEPAVRAKTTPPHRGSGPGKGSECECPQDVHPVGGCVHRYPSSLGLLVRVAVAVAAGAAKLQRDYVGQDLRCSDPAFFSPYSPPVKLRLTSTVHTTTPLSSSSSSLLMCNNGATQQQGKHSANFRKFHWKNNRP